MKTPAQYREWQLDTRRDDHRVLLIEAEYADREIIAGHGRTNFLDSLNEITSLTVKTYSNNSIEVTFSQPTSQEGYSWEVWVDEDVVLTTQGGYYSFSATVNRTYRIAVASVKGSSYSKPWVANATPANNAQTISGAVGDWQDVGNGAGTTGNGVVRLASFPWNGDGYAPYDDFLTLDPEIEENIDSFGGVGDFRALDAFDGVEWGDLYWRGHTCTWLFGDEDWTRTDFVPIAVAMIDDVRLVDGIEYQFDLMDGGQSAAERFDEGDVVWTDTAVAILGKIARATTQFPYFSFYGMTGEQLLYGITVEIDDSKSVETVVRQVATSIGAYIRINLEGIIRVYSTRDEIDEDITEDDIIEGEVRVVETIQAAKRIIIELSDGRILKASTGASTGNLVETIEVKTLLNNIPDANKLMSRYLDYYAVPHPIWEFGVMGIADLISIGERVSVTHPLFTGNGIVRRIKRRPLSSFSTIEIET